MTTNMQLGAPDGTLPLPNRHIHLSLTFTPRGTVLSQPGLPGGGGVALLLLLLLLLLLSLLLLAGVAATWLMPFCCCLNHDSMGLSAGGTELSGGSPSMLRTKVFFSSRAEPSCRALVVAHIMAMAAEAL